MAVTYSNMLPLETLAPDFDLPEPLSGTNRTLEALASDQATVVMFLCNHCPYVKHVLDGLLALAREYTARDVRFVAINSPDTESYPEDSPENMARLAREKDFPFPFLFDEDQSVAKAYQAACTPDFFVFDGDLGLRYRGQMDGSRPESDVSVDGRDLRAALDAVLAGETPSSDQKPSCGCNIKWRKGNEPT